MKHHLSFNKLKLTFVYIETQSEWWVTETTEINCTPWGYNSCCFVQGWQTQSFVNFQQKIHPQHLLVFWRTVFNWDHFSRQGREPFHGERNEGQAVLSLKNSNACYVGQTNLGSLSSVVENLMLQFCKKRKKKQLNFLNVFIWQKKNWKKSKIG